MFLPISSQAAKSEDQILKLKSVINSKCDLWNRIENKNLVSLSIKNSQEKNKMIVTLYPLEKFSRRNLITEG